MHHGDSGGSLVAERTLVPSLAGDGDRRSGDFGPSASHPNDFSLHALALNESELAALRLETFRRRYQLLGFSTTAVESNAHDQVQGAHGRSYKRPHYLFIHWSEHYKVDRNTFSVVQLIEFLQLASSSGFAASTVTLFRWAIVAFHVCANDVLSSRELRHCLAHIKKSAPPVSLSRPEVDLTPSFGYLRTIASDSSSPLNLLSKKCAFLLAAAAFLCPSDLHHISFPVAFFMDAFGSDICSICIRSDQSDTFSDQMPSDICSDIG